MHKNISRGLGLAAAAVIAATGLVACSDSGEAGTDTLTIWTRTDGEPYMRDLAEKFAAERDGLKVEVTALPNSDVQTKLGQAISAGDTPDVVAIDVVKAPYFISVDAFQDLTDKISELPYADSLLEGQLDAGTFEDRQYVMPFTADSSALFYNKDLFAKAGLDPEKAPETWDEFVAAANAVSALGDDNVGYHFSAGCGGCAAFVLNPMLWAAGGDFVDLESGSLNPDPKFDDPLTVEFIEMLRSAVDGGGITSASQVDGGENYGGAFEGGKLGMVGSGSFQMSMFQQEPLPFELGVAPLPGKEAGQFASFAGGDVLAIPTGAKNSDLAWEFLAWASDDAAQTTLAEGGYTPIRTDLFDEIYSSKGPEFAALAEATLNGRVPYTLSFNALFSDPNGPMVSLMQAGVFGKGDPAAAAATAQAAAEQIVEQSSQ